MVNATSITKIYLSFMKDEISKEEAINQLLVLVLKNPAFFGLQSLCKEKLQDFIFNIIHKLDNIFQKYDSNKSIFSTYFQVNIRYFYETWKKNKSQSNAKEKVCKNMNYFFNNEKFNGDNYEDIFNYQDGLNSVVNENEPFYYPTTKRRIRKKLNDFEVLVIALKSSYYISNEQIEKIMQNTYISKIKLTNYIKELNEKLIKKICLKNKLEMSVNNDFMKMEVLKINYNNLKYSNPLRAEDIKHKYNMLKKKYAKRLKKLKKIKIVPSDNDISTILNISPSKVRYILTKNYTRYNIQTNVRKSC